MIIREGMNVYANDVEAVLLAHPRTWRQPSLVSEQREDPRRIHAGPPI